MDKLLRAEIVQTVNNAMLTYAEKWVTAETLCNHVESLTVRFLKDHGDILPRTRVEWTDDEGNRHAQAWLYPLHRIQNWIETGKIKELKSS